MKKSLLVINNYATNCQPLKSSFQMQYSSFLYAALSISRDHNQSKIIKYVHSKDGNI